MKNYIVTVAIAAAIVFIFVILFFVRRNKEFKTSLSKMGKDYEKKPKTLAWFVITDLFKSLQVIVPFMFVIEKMKHSFDVSIVIFSLIIGGITGIILFKMANVKVEQRESLKYFDISLKPQFDGTNTYLIISLTKSSYVLFG